MYEPDYLLGIHSFKGRSDDEIDISRGDFIEVIEDDSAFDDSWYIGRNLTTNATGLFPKVFTTAVAKLPDDVKKRIAEMDSQANVNPPTGTHQNYAEAIKDSPILQHTEPNEYQLSDYSARQSFAPHQDYNTQTAGSTYNVIDKYKPEDEFNQNMDYGMDQLSQKAIDMPDKSPQTPNIGMLGFNGDASGFSEVSGMSAMSRSTAISDIVAQSDLDAAISEMAQPVQRKHSVTPTHNNPIQISKPNSVGDVNGPFSRVQTPPQLPDIPILTPPSVSTPSGFSSSGDVNERRISRIPNIDYTVQNWTASDVAAHFARKGFHEEAPLFIKHRITGAILLEMDRDTLKEIGITSFGPRFEIDKDIRFFRNTLGLDVREDQWSPETQKQARVYMQDNGISGSTSASNLYTQSMPGMLAPQQMVFQSSNASKLKVRTKPSMKSMKSMNSGTGTASTGTLPHEYGPSMLNSPTNSQMYNSPQSFEFASRFSPRLDDPTQFDFSPGSEEYRSSHDRNLSSTTSSSAPTSQRFKEKYDFEANSNLKRAATEHVSQQTHDTEENDGDSDPIYKRENSVSQSSYKSDKSRKHKHRTSVLSVLSSSSPRRGDSKGSDKDSGKSKDNDNESSKGKKNKDSKTKSYTKDEKSKNKNSKADDMVKSEISAKEKAARNNKRATSESTLKTMMRPGLMKQKTSAFQEGIQKVSAENARSTANKSGWMHKRNGTGFGVWSKRFFTLHGTRLSYFSSFKENQERGLIDITGHRVVPIKDKEILINLSAAGMGAGRHCFKLIPPGPGYKKGVAFTAPKVHYFAVESEEEMRSWQEALTTATIERDETIPVISTCQTPTMSLPKAQELMAERLATKGEIGSLINP